MIVGFSRHGQGSAAGPSTISPRKQNPDGTERHPAPEVLRGDPELIGQLIDALPFKHKYTSGVLSFAPGEVITPEMEERIMDEFETRRVRRPRSRPVRHPVGQPRPCRA